MQKEKKRRLIRKKIEKFALQNSKYDKKKQELIFVKTAFECAVDIECNSPFLTLDELPDLPQGLILIDNHGLGALQQL
jgi:hypothetical protein